MRRVSKYSRNRRLSNAASRRRTQWLAASCSSISSESSEHEDLACEMGHQACSSASNGKDHAKLTRERRLRALRDKLSSKGQTFESLELLSTNKRNELASLLRTRRSRVVLDVCLLWACVYDVELISYFLKLGANPDAADAEGFSALHLAAENGDAQSIVKLVNAGAQVTGPSIWDNKKEVTPMMLAARVGRIETLRELINADADVNTGLNTGKEVALHYAVRARSIECVKLLLESSAVPNPSTLYSETPLHVAVGEGYEELVAVLLEAGADVRASRGITKMAALHIAAQEGNVRIVKRLLDAGADPKQTNSRGQTPLHLGARSQSADTVQELLRHKADPNARDQDGKTPLHAGIFKGSRCYECLELLIQANADPNAADFAGYTPLHLAALNESSYCVQMFLKKGGDVSAKTKGGLSALNIILRKTPTGLYHLQEVLDAAIDHDDRDPHRDPETQTQLDFSVFRGAKGREPECRLLTCFMNEGQRLLLKHPLCESFLQLKWQRVRMFFIINIIFYTILTLAITLYTLQSFTSQPMCPSLSHEARVDPIPTAYPTTHQPKVEVPMNAPSQHPAASLNSSNLTATRMLFIVNFRVGQTTTEEIAKCLMVVKEILTVVIWIMTAALTTKELVQLLDSPRTYLSTLDNFLVWPIIIFTYSLTISGYYAETRSDWEYHAAAYLILFTWIELLLLIGRFPLFGLYIQMFAQGTKNLGKFLLAYMCFINAFSLSFGVLFHNHDPFKNILLRLLQTIVMMTGELEYDERFFKSEQILYPGTAHVIFAMFLIFGTVILMNLLVGLAVSDIQGLQQSAGLDRLVRQTQLIASLENIFFSRWLSMALPSGMLVMVRDRILLLPSHYGGVLSVSPKNVNGFKLSHDLLESIRRVATYRNHRTWRRTAFANFRSISQATQYGHGSQEKDTARGIEAVHCGLELLIREADDSKKESRLIKESLATVVAQLEKILSKRKDQETDVRRRESC
ncbi:transient receptor potential channel pyrexia [Hyalella azteca]|uniref:Transient receptor potential channel pyrexia n=1 Tax=Hyalella azteca TaxID=294128 RepID=A0A8B7PKG5_HYAAZ|nr:transient receptor potential channel pyrexia [Hyalella azteca]